MKLKKIIFGIASIVGVSLALSTTCLAGSMNAHESSLYSAASGTFEHEGKQYKAAPEYLAQLQTYLCRDDIELTADQAEAAKAEMYANVAQGVTEGYIIPVETTNPPGEPGDSTNPPETEPGNPNNSTDPADPSEPSKPNDPGKKDPEPTDSENPGTESPGTDTPATDALAESTEVQSTDIGQNTKGQGVVSSNGTIFGGVSEKEKLEMEETLATRIPEEKAETEITYNKADNTIAFQTKGGTTYRLPEDIRLEMFGDWIRVVEVVSVLLCIIAIACGVVLLTVGAMKFQKKKPKSSSHTRRKYVRKVVGLVLAVVIAMDAIGLVGAMWMQMSFFDDSVILEKLSDSGYYHEAYNDMMDDVHAVMQASGCMPDICDDVLTYEHFMFATKNQIQMALKGKTSSATFEDVKTDVVAALDGIEYFTQDSKEMLGAAVLTIYQTQVRNVIGDVAYAIKTVIGDELKLVGVFLAVSALLSVGCILCSERYPHRGVRRIARGVLMAGAAALFICVWMLVTKPYTGYYIAPDYLYLFTVYMIENSVKILAVTGALTIALSALLMLSAASMKKRLER